MKIAFYAYPEAFQSPGGGEVFLLKMKESLEQKGVYVKLFDQWNDKLKDFDILHVFGSVKVCIGIMETAKSLGVKTVLSPIFWSTLRRSMYEYGGAGKRAKMALQHMAKVVFPFIPSGRKRVMELSDIIIPNSTAEAEQILRLFWINRSRMRVAYLGVDDRFMSADRKFFIEKYNLEDFVLSVGRIEPRKNQLNLIRALNGTGLKLVFIGDAVSGCEQYYKKCRDTADSNTIFIPKMNHEDSLLSSAYAACSVFVLQGWFETPGLVALEAGLAGARLAVTKDGSAREYFKDYAEYFDPSSVASIKKSIEKALNKEKDNKLRKYIADNFLWPHAADKTIKVYKEALDEA
jgi:glycosyltransferase involved in cell wall biosynthesis